MNSASVTEDHLNHYYYYDGRNHVLCSECGITRHYARIMRAYDTECEICGVADSGAVCQCETCMEL